MDRQQNSDRIVGAIFAVALAAVLASFFNAWLPFGIAVCGLLVLGLALGFGSLRRPVALLFAMYVLLLAGMVWLQDSPRLLGGLPAATALLVYGIWPMPLLAALIYALVFPTSVLPEDKLQAFLDKHARR